MSLLYSCKIVSHLRRRRFYAQNMNPTRGTIAIDYAVNDFLISNSRTYFFTTIIDMKGKATKTKKKIGK
jgi:hypothetical protein